MSQPLHFYIIILKLLPCAMLNIIKYVSIKFTLWHADVFWNLKRGWELAQKLVCTSTVLVIHLAPTPSSTSVNGETKVPLWFFSSVTASISGTISVIALLLDITGNPTNWDTASRFHRHLWGPNVVHSSGGGRSMLLLISFNNWETDASFVCFDESVIVLLAGTAGWAFHFSPT